MMSSYPITHSLLVLLMAIAAGRDPDKLLYRKVQTVPGE